MNAAARRWIHALRLRPHPEGGHYRETYRAAGTLPRAALPRGYGGPRAFSTAILFLLQGREVSAFHRLRSDELWHFHAGAGLTVHTIDTAGRHRRLRLGARPARGEQPQAVLPAGCWFAAELTRGRGCALVGCTVAPGFDFADFELADPARLARRFPRHAALIRRLSPPGGRTP